MEALEIAVEIPAQPRRRLALAVVCGAGALACLAGLRALSHREGLEPGSRLAALASLTAAFLLLAAIAWTACGRRPLTERLGLQPGLAGSGTVLLLAIGLLGLSQALDQIIDLLGLRASSQLAQYDAAVAGAPALAWPFLLIGLAVAPGIGEEIFFRGLVQRGLARWLGRAGAVLAASAAFGAVHGDPVHAAGAFGLGLYLGAVAELTGGTRAPIACHVLNNLAAVGSVALPQPLPLPTGTLVAVGLAVAGFSLLTASRHLHRRR